MEILVTMPLMHALQLFEIERELNSEYINLYLQKYYFFS